VDRRNGEAVKNKKKPKSMLHFRSREVQKTPSETVYLLPPHVRSVSRLANAQASASRSRGVVRFADWLIPGDVVFTVRPFASPSPCPWPMLIAVCARFRAAGLRGEGNAACAGIRAVWKVQQELHAAL